MIIDKNPLPDDPTPAEAPPAYDTIQRTPVETNDNKRLPALPPSSSQPVAGTSSPISPLGEATSPTGLLRSQPSSSNFKGKGRAYTSNVSWFNWAAYRTNREVHTTVLGLVKDLVREHKTSSTAAIGILESCAEACSGYDLSLSSVLQEKSIENHTPLYWAIVKRPPDGEEDADAVPDLLTALISYATPLTPQTISDVRHACLLTSDQALFQRLRMSPEFAPLSGTDEMLLGHSIPPDDVLVENVPGDEGAFTVDFSLIDFQKRMLISKRVGIEFIARARMWKLEFFIAESPPPDNVREGSWCISLWLLEHSSPTWVDSRLIIPEPNSPSKSSGTSSPLKSTSPLPTSPTSLLDRVRSSSNTPKPKPTIEVRLTSTQELMPAPSRRQRRRFGLSDSIVVSLDNSVMGASLQYTGTSYIAADGVLRARLEGKLGKPSADNDCVVC